MELVDCIYCSAATGADLAPAELQGLLDDCRRKNAIAGITGILLYQKGSFFQVLEGDRDVAEALFERISEDKRHDRATKIILEPITEHAFGEWTMGCPKLSSSQLARIPGLNDFFARGKSYLDLGEGRTKTPLRAFTEGRWRMSIS
jgi:uncharacterized Fe-S cluster-containing MiaB family protein